MIVFGTRMFGQTDRVPGLFYVATKFFHVNFVPLCPLSTFLIIEARGLGPRGINIPMSTESLIAAWLRALAWIVAFVFSAVTIAYVPSFSSSDDDDNHKTVSAATRKTQCQQFTIFLVGSILLLGIAVFLQCHPRFKNASYERATEICSTILPGSRGLQRLVDQHFGKDVVVMASDAIMMPATTTTDAEDGISSGGHDNDHMELAIASSASFTDEFDHDDDDHHHHWVHPTMDVSPGPKMKNSHHQGSERIGHRTRSKLPTATVLEVL